jgi:hypothetical protein
MSHQSPQANNRYPIQVHRPTAPAYNHVGGGVVSVPGQVDLFVTLDWLKGKPLGVERVSAEAAIELGEQLIAAGKRSQNLAAARDASSQ